MEPNFFHKLEEASGYTFQNKLLLKQAMTHSSYANERRYKKLKDNERLEFLGDAVLEVISSEYLFRHYPELPEGDLTKLRASIVCEPTLAMCAGELNLGEYLLLGKGEEHTGGRNRNSIVSDAMEALIGAIYLDGGFASAKEFVHRFIINYFANLWKSDDSVHLGISSSFAMARPIANIRFKSSIAPSKSHHDSSYSSFGW